MKSSWYLLVILILIVGCVTAMPPTPSAFYGDVTYNGTALPDGYSITAKINDVIGGVVDIENGQYGYGENTLIVLSYDSSGIVEFYIGEDKIGENEFVERAVTKVDFDLDFLPSSEEDQPNGVCEIELGECSNNILDCGVEKTDACAENGVCDSLIGETCSNTPEDCGICEYCGDSVCNNGEDCSSCSADCGECTTGDGGGSGGGGGGGSSSNSKTVVPTIPFTTISTDGEAEINNSELDLENFEGQESLGQSGMTGAVIDFAKSGRGIGIIIVILVLAGGIGLFYWKKRKTQNEQE